mmetsp:Transcript_103951/g.291164  ORF Transcript_103951/g.291164 Transcript_103951/m.291164 type:complete len:126 (-) Transcript_103951:72-449(-)|eukprot:CAMPEP_0176215732 /NCGR_PEP_ID=MMETSP0121_2-20121125/16832_1 /TAXON_ID=160619 /ORGANISM="Kryptoperidinium foliaceum, Strain CCMP 1326" /LENGTH=125 /DNA_ID=CAMNT_0017554847 /DNA_START=76 /DNA_END=453 /DNA_ORIENTATION=-
MICCACKPLAATSEAVAADAKHSVGAQVSESEPVLSAVSPRTSTMVLRKARADEKLGIDLTELSLTVVRIRPGLVQAWNDAHPDSQVMPGDCIVSVNGVRGDPAAVMNLLVSTEGELVLIIARSD